MLPALSSFRVALRAANPWTCFVQLLCCALRMAFGIFVTPLAKLSSKKANVLRVPMREGVGPAFGRAPSQPNLPHFRQQRQNNHSGCFYNRKTCTAIEHTIACLWGVFYWPRLLASSARFTQQIICLVYPPCSA